MSATSDSFVALAPRWRVMMPLGVLAMVAGFACVIAPQVSTLAVSFVVGVLLMFDGVLQGVHAMNLRGQRSFRWRLALAVLSLGAGALLLVSPDVGIISLTIVVAAFFVLGGVFKLSLAMQIRRLEGWGLLTVAGGLSLLLGAVILLQLPQVAEWVVGVLVGIDLIVAGWWMISMGAAARRRPPSGDRSEDSSEGASRPAGTDPDPYRPGP